ncbi:MAG: carboxypeptidase regulatory-like domain-containing protein [Cyclobacteriaceae bacterium]|nr:carboxypeptidase regulatory-like domain-containing protein [Cyclobacteriaceae bacterium]
MNTVSKISFALVMIALFSFTNISKDQFFKINLKITVLDELGNIQEGASVKLFLNEEDYQKEKNAISKAQFTDEKGVVVYKELESREYYILVEKDDLNNNGGAVKTDKLQEKKVNKINIIID